MLPKRRFGKDEQTMKLYTSQTKIWEDRTSLSECAFEALFMNEIKSGIQCSCMIDRIACCYLL